MQDAYIAEQGDSLGSWKTIGYTIAAMSAANAAESGNFNYTGALTDDAKLSNSTQSGVWKAESKAKMNDCIAKSAWSLDIKEAAASSNEGIAEYTANISNNTKGDCSVLTPNFQNFSSNGKLGSGSGN